MRHGLIRGFITEDLADKVRHTTPDYGREDGSSTQAPEANLSRAVPLILIIAWALSRHEYLYTKSRVYYISWTNFRQYITVER